MRARNKLVNTNIDDPVRQQIDVTRPTNLQIENMILSRIICDKEFLLNEEDNNNRKPDYNLYPELPIKLGELNIKALIDTGCNITCINKSWLNENKDKLGRIEELPLTGINVTTANGHKIKQINKIVLIETTIEGLHYGIQCIVVPNLVKEIIIGTDTMREWCMEINMRELTFSLVIDNQKRTVSFRNSNDNIQAKVNYVTAESYNTVNELVESQKTDITVLVNENQSLNEDQKIQLKQLLEKHNKIFSKKPGRCNAYEHKIEVYSNKPFVQRSYPIPICHQNAVQNEIDRMLREDIIERSTSTYINPIVPVIKKSGEVRLCLDARKLNEIIIPDYDCNLSINELLAKGRSTDWMSTIDMTCSFWQIGLSKESRKYTAFQHKGKTYHFKVTPYGLSTSSAALVRCLDAISNEELDEFILLYVDDMVCQSSTYEQHLQQLGKIFEMFEKSGMTINITKSIFCRQSIPFLGYTLTTRGIKANDEKVKCIQDFPSPKSSKQVKAFIGLVNFYNKFIEKYSDLVHPLLHLTSKKTKFHWSEREEGAFKAIKRAFLRENYLEYPDVNKEFFLQTDASQNCIGGHIYQYRDNGEKAAIMFMSRTLKGSELNYYTTEKELLAIVFCLQKARPILLGANLTIQTDHQAITFMNKCRLLNSRLTRWLLSIQEYSFKIQFCKGKENVVADTLSRYPQDRCYTTEEPELRITYIKRNLDKDFKKDLLRISNLQKEDENLKLIYNDINENDAYKVVENILFKKCKDIWKIILPEKIVDDLIWECHKYYCHTGPKKCYDILNETFTFKKLKKRVRTLIRSCDLCQKCKHTNKYNYGETKGIVTSEPNQQLSIDLFGPMPTGKRGMKFLLVTLDTFSKFVKLYTLRRATSKAIIRCIFQDYIPKYGMVQRIQTDHGTQFTATEWEVELSSHNIKHIYSPVRRPHSNMVERINKELGRCLRTYCHDKHKSWVDYIPMLNTYLNEIPHDTTGFTPLEIHQKEKPTRFWEKYLKINKLEQEELGYKMKLRLVEKRIRNKANKRAEYFNKNHKLSSFNVSDLVLVKEKYQSDHIAGEMAKLFQLYSGPYIINNKLGNSTYELGYYLKPNKIKGMYHIQDLKLYIKPLKQN